YVKLGIPLEEAEIKNRFEIRLKNERAYLALIDFVKNKNIEKTAFSIINHYLRFADNDGSKQRSKWPTNE
ncbi:replication initiation factor domain-containing protein, partial [Enterococcus faecalis]